MRLLFIISLSIGLFIHSESVYTRSNEDTLDISQDENASQTSSSSSSKDLDTEPLMTSDPCYDRLTGKPQRCIPNFENVAYGRRVVASSTCGSPSMSYCVNTNSQSAGGSQSPLSKKPGYCEKCDSKQPGSVREAKFLTDLEETNTTCWVSGPVYEPGQLANLTLDISFGKKYELTYIR